MDGWLIVIIMLLSSSVTGAVFGVIGAAVYAMLHGVNEWEVASCETFGDAKCPSIKSLKRRYESSDKGWIAEWLEESAPSEPE